MSRPRNKRCISAPPIMEGFKPFGMPVRYQTSLRLLFEEYEAIKLVDYEGLHHDAAAERMNISRPTFTRIYDKARKTISKAMVEGQALIIGGGDCFSEEKWYRCRHCMKIMTSDKEVCRCNFCDSEKISDIINDFKNEDCVTNKRDRD